MDGKAGLQGNVTDTLIFGSTAKVRSQKLAELTRVFFWWEER
jgi:hypothetical protein